MILVTFPMPLYHTWNELAIGSGKFYGAVQPGQEKRHFMQWGMENQDFFAKEKMRENHVNYPVFVIFY